MWRRQFLRAAWLAAGSLIFEQQRLWSPGRAVTYHDAQQVYNQVNPFSDGLGEPLIIPRAAVDEDVRKVIDQVVSNARYRLEQERAAVEKHWHVRLHRLKRLEWEAGIDLGLERDEHVHHPFLVDDDGELLRLRTGKVDSLEGLFLDDLVHYGVELTRWKDCHWRYNRARYDPDWRAVLRDHPHLRPMDCTRYFLEEYVHLTGEESLLEDYFSERNALNRGPRFAWMFAMRMREDYESVLIIPDTKDERSYVNGARGGGLNKDILANVLIHQHYLDPAYEQIPSWVRERYLDEHDIPLDGPVPDYHVLDDAVRGEEFKDFLKGVRGVGAKHDFYHLYIVDRGKTLEAKWGNNPLYANTFKESDLLRLIDEESAERIQNFVLFVPRGSVAAYVDGRVTDVIERLR
ncbi:hypothetical protein JXA12_01460 [Candidatus Woesearchaeota archaeon]|nr:hypothetical protein [Candidatus Woesearchaeota archaeon]